MSEATQTLLVLTGTLVLGIAGCADKTAIHSTDIESRQAARASDEVDAQAKDSAGLADSPSALHVDSRNERFAAKADGDVGQNSETQRPQILTNGRSSLYLRLTALVVLGLCSSAHRLKKLYARLISECHHSFGPPQIGHSVAVEPDSICPAPICAFIQPVHTAEDRASQYCPGTILSLWRKSQFTVSVLAPRGPPRIS